MKRPALLFAVLLLVSVAFGQQQAEAPYEPAVAPPSMGGYGGGGYGGYYGGGATTAAGSAATGMANLISSRGSANLNNSAAAINMTQARKNEIENHQQYTNTYFEMRATNKAARAAEDGPPPTPDQLARIAHEGVPKELSPSQFNHVSGQIAWPQALQLDTFATERQQLDTLLGSYSQVGNLNYGDQLKARKLINDMAAKLKAQVRDLPPPDYMTCRSFLNSLIYATSKVQLS
jgi:hypothetical protein